MKQTPLSKLALSSAGSALPPEPRSWARLARRTRLPTCSAAQRSSPTTSAPSVMAAHSTPPHPAAIDAAANVGGGTVVAAPGTYLSGTLFLKSGVHLYLEAGAVLFASKDVADYRRIVQRNRCSLTKAGGDYRQRAESPCRQTDMQTAIKTKTKMTITGDDADGQYVPGLPGGTSWARQQWHGGTSGRLPKGLDVSPSLVEPCDGRVTCCWARYLTVTLEFESSTEVSMGNGWTSPGLHRGADGPAQFKPRETGDTTPCRAGGWKASISRR